jgi:peptide/nickel transport system permease protein
MLRFFLIRFGRSVLTVALVVTFAFVVLRLSGDPALLIMSVDAPPEAIAAFRSAWGLDDPIWIQYLRTRRDRPGRARQSMRDGRPALSLVAERIPATLVLTIPALLIKVGVGIPAGIYAALHRDTLIDRLVMTAAVAGFTVPSFVLGLVLVLVFSVQLGWLPSGGQDTWRPRDPAGAHARHRRGRRPGALHAQRHAGGAGANPTSGRRAPRACLGPGWCEPTPCPTPPSRP